MQRSMIFVVLAICALAASGSAWSQPVRPGAAVRIDSSDSAQPTPAQPDKAYQSAERDKAMAKKPENGCACASANRCAFSLDFNYCIAPDGHRVYLQRFWGQ